MLKKLWNWFSGDGTVTKLERNLLPPKQALEENTKLNREEAEAFARKKELWERNNLPYGA